MSHISDTYKYQGGTRTYLFKPPELVIYTVLVIGIIIPDVQYYIKSEMQNNNLPRQIIKLIKLLVNTA